MTVEIKKRYTGEIIATGETLKEAAEKSRPTTHSPGFSQQGTLFRARKVRSLGKDSQC